MAAQRCNRCDLNYPLWQGFCDACKGMTSRSEAHYPDDLDAAASRFEERVCDWRLKTLLEAGYPVPVAEKLARRRDIDLHDAATLPVRGCPPELAAQILL